MATTTAKLSLRKPDPTDNVSVTTDISDNMQKIDDGFAGISAGFRNAIRNGDMGVIQRGAGAFTVTSAHTADGWIKGHSGGTHSITLEGIGLGTYDNTGLGMILRSVVAAQSVAGDYASIQQRIESVRTLAGKQVTLSFIAIAASGTPKLGVEVVQHFGTGGAPSADVNTAVSAVTISTTATRYTVSFTVPTVLGKTRGTNNNDYLAVIFWLSAGSTYATRASSIGIQNATIDISDIQLEAGSVATAFERLPQAVQLAWCQRYYYAIGTLAGDTGSSIFYGHGFAISATVGQIAVPFPTAMRVIPTFLSVGAGTSSLTDGVTSSTATSNAIYANNTTAKSALLSVSVASGLTAFRPYRWEQSSASITITFSSEL